LRACLSHCQLRTGVSIALPILAAIPEFLFQRRSQNPRHVLVEPFLKHGTEHVLDAVLEALLRCAVRTVLSGGGTLRLAKRRGRPLPRERVARLRNAPI